MTVNWNNHMSEFYARAAYQGIAAANDLYDVMPSAVYHHNVGQLVYGDDNDFALTVPVSEWFNFYSMRDFLDRYNIWITTSSKDASDERATVDFLDSDFLCRRPRLDHIGEYGVKFVAYPYKEVYDSLNWQSDHVDEKFALYQNAVGILYRSVGLGREEFYKEFDKLEKALADVGVRAPLPRWQDVKRNFTNPVINFTGDGAMLTPFTVLGTNLEVNMRETPYLDFEEFKFEELAMFVEPHQEVADLVKREMNAAGTEEAVVGSETPAETLVPSSSLPIPPSVSVCTAEDMCRRQQPVLYYNSAQTSNVGGQMNDVFVLSSPSETNRFTPSFFYYFGTTFRFFQGKLTYQVLGNPGPTMASFSNLSRQTTLAASWMGNQQQPNANGVPAGSMPIAWGSPADTPLAVEIPGQHLTPDHWMLVPINRVEQAEMRPFFSGGQWIVGPLAAGTTRIYASAGDGFKFCFVYRIIPRRGIYPPVPPPSERKHANHHSDVVRVRTEGAVTSGLAKGVKTVTGAYDNMKQFGAKAVDVADRVRDSAANMRFDTPNDGSDAQPVTQRHAYNMAGMVGGRYNQVLGPDPGEAPETNLPIGTGVPETQLQRMAQMECLLATVRITTSDTPGKVIFSVPITCCPELITKVSTSGLYTPTMCEHIFQAFEYWASDFNYTFQFLNPPLANMRIAVVTRFGPADPFTPLTTIPIAELSGQYTKVFNLGVEDTLKVNVPFVSPHKFCVVPTPGWDYQYTPVPYSTNVDISHWYMTGMLYVVVVTPYQVNETMAQQIDMNVFFAAGDRADFKTPNSGLSQVTFLPATDEDEVKREMMTTSGGIGGDMEDDEKKDVDARPSGGPTVPSAMSGDGVNALWERSYVIDEVAWTPSAAQGDILYTKNLPFGVLPSGPVTVVVGSFHYFRTELEFNFGLSTSISSQGQLVAYYTPLDVDPSTLTLKEVLLGPHVLLKAGRTTAGIVRVPFVHPMNALLVSLDEAIYTNLSEYSQGTITLRVFNQFLSGSDVSTQSPTVNVSVKFLKPELSVPNESAAFSSFLTVRTEMKELEPVEPVVPNYPLYGMDFPVAGSTMTRSDTLELDSFLYQRWGPEAPIGRLSYEYRLGAPWVNPMSIWTDYADLSCANCGLGFFCQWRDVTLVTISGRTAWYCSELCSVIDADIYYQAVMNDQWGEPAQLKG